VDINLLDR